MGGAFFQFWHTDELRGISAGRRLGNWWRWWWRYAICKRSCRLRRWKWIFSNGKCHFDCGAVYHGHYNRRGRQK
nr:MAG TPA: hypothetical protein [Caudoviricetes sp.]